MSQAMSQAIGNETTGYYTRGGSLPRQVTAHVALDTGRDTVLVDGQPARIGEDFFEREGDAVVAALRANVAEEQRLRQQLNTQGDNADLRGQLVAVNERIVTLQRRGAELEQLAQASQDRQDDSAPSASQGQ